jgi:hypothetical protein
MHAQPQCWSQVRLLGCVPQVTFTSGGVDVQLSLPGEAHATDRSRIVASLEPCSFRCTVAAVAGALRLSADGSGGQARVELQGGSALPAAAVGRVGGHHWAASVEAGAGLACQGALELEGTSLQLCPSALLLSAPTSGPVALRCAAELCAVSCSANQQPEPEAVGLGALETPVEAAFGGEDRFSSVAPQLAAEGPSMASPAEAAGQQASPAPSDCARGNGHAAGSLLNAAAEECTGVTEESTCGCVPGPVEPGAATGASSAAGAAAPPADPPPSGLQPVPGRCFSAELQLGAATVTLIAAAAGVGSPPADTVLAQCDELRAEVRAEPSVLPSEGAGQQPERPRLWLDVALSAQRPALRLTEAAVQHLAGAAALVRAARAGPARDPATKVDEAPELGSSCNQDEALGPTAASRIARRGPRPALRKLRLSLPAGAVAELLAQVPLDDSNALQRQGPAHGVEGRLVAALSGLVLSTQLAVPLAPGTARRGGALCVTGVQLDLRLGQEGSAAPSRPSEALAPPELYRLLRVDSAELLLAEAPVTSAESEASCGRVEPALWCRLKMCG